jgi:hypothetical protein
MNRFLVRSVVWDGGTWEPHATDDPAASVAAAWIGG